MGFLWFAIGLICAVIAYGMASGRSKAAKVWAEIGGLDPLLGPVALVAILFTRKPDA
jgi:hypothetical protein